MCFFSKGFYIYVCRCFAHTYICVPPLCLVPVEVRSVQSLGTGVTHGCEAPCRCWKPNPHLLQELLVVNPSHILWALVLPETHLLRKGLGLLAAQQLAVSGYGWRAWTEVCRHRLLTPRLRSGWALFLFIQSHKLLYFSS